MSKDESGEIDYRRYSYDRLSKEFRILYPFATRAFQVIGMMYNRLTLVDGYKHKQAMEKMTKVHSDLPRFSPRNMRRYLPEDNSNVPRRVRSPRPKRAIREIKTAKVPKVEGMFFPKTYSVTVGWNETIVIRKSSELKAERIINEVYESKERKAAIKELNRKLSELIYENVFLQGRICQYHFSDKGCNTFLEMSFKDYTKYITDDKLQEIIGVMATEELNKNLRMKSGST